MLVPVIDSREQKKIALKTNISLDFVKKVFA